MSWKKWAQTCLMERWVSHTLKWILDISTEWDFNYATLVVDLWSALLFENNIVTSVKVKDHTYSLFWECIAICGLSLWKKKGCPSLLHFILRKCKISKVKIKCKSYYSNLIMNLLPHSCTSCPLVVCVLLIPHIGQSEWMIMKLALGN